MQTHALDGDRLCVNYTPTVRPEEGGLGGGLFCGLIFFISSRLCPAQVGGRVPGVGVRVGMFLWGGGEGGMFLWGGCGGEDVSVRWGWG